MKVAKAEIQTPISIITIYKNLKYDKTTLQKW